MTKHAFCPVWRNNATRELHLLLASDPVHGPATENLDEAEQREYAHKIINEYGHFGGLHTEKDLDRIDWVAIAATQYRGEFEDNELVNCPLGDEQECKDALLIN